MKPFRFSALHSRVLNLAGLLTLSFGSASAADLYWDGTGSSGAVTSWGFIDGWSTVAAGGTSPAALPGESDAVVFRADNIKTGALTISLDDIRSIQGIKTLRNAGPPLTYSQEATTTVTGTASGRVLKLFGMPTADPNKTIGIDHAAGGITLGTAALPVKITIHSPHQTWNSNVVGGNGGAPGAAALMINGEIAGGIDTSDVTLCLVGQNTGTTVNGTINNGIAPNLNLEVGAVGGPSGAIWTFNGTNTYTGTTKVVSGTLRITNADSLPALAKVSVESGATLALRVGPGTFTSAEISQIGSDVTFKAGANLALDTVNSVAEVDGGLEGPGNFRKIGANTLILNGPNTYTSNGFTIAEGNVAIRRPTGVFAGVGSNAGKAIATASNTALLAIVGQNGFTEAEVSLLPGLVTTTTANIGISTIDGDVNYSGAFFGARRFTKGDTGTLTLLGNRTDTGGVNITGGTLRVFSLPNGGGASPLGNLPASGTASGGIWLNGGRLMYAGPGVTTDRYFETRASGTLDSSGTGPLVLNNATPFPHTNGVTTARTITLTGDAPGENKITGAIADASAAVSITKQGSTNWTLSGTNTYTGTTRNNGGLLTLDYTTGNPISTGAVVVNAGQVLVKAAAAGTTESFPLTIGASQHTYGHFKLQGGVNLTVSTLSGGGLAQRGDLIDMSGHANNNITVTALNSDNRLRAVSGILQANTATEANGRANLIVRDKTGAYGFPALSSGTSGNLVRAATFTNVATGLFTNVANNTVHYRFGPGNYQAGAQLVFNTLTMDSTSGEIDIFLDVHDLNPSGTGKAILVTGNNDVTLSNPGGSTGTGLQPIWWHNYLEPNATFHLTAGFGHAQFMILDGSGFTDYSGSGFGANFHVNGGLVRVSEPQAPADTVGEFRISSGGVLELGAQTTSHQGIDFGKGVRSSPAGGIAFYGDSGLSAFSGEDGVAKRIVDFKVTTGTPGQFVSQQLAWGKARFLTQPDSDLDGDYAFKLSSTRADIPIEIRNKIDLNGRSRTVDVANGSSSLDAELTGELSGGAAAGLVKAGAGTLRLSGVNTYLGETQIRDGILRIDSASLDPKSSLSITGTGKLEITSGNVSVAAVSINGVSQPNGEVIDPTRISGGKLFVGSQLTPYQQWVVDKTLAAGESAGDLDADFDGIKNIIEYAVGSEPKTAGSSVLTKLAGSPHAVRFNRAAGRTDLDLYLESSPTLGAPWTVIASSLDGGTFASAVGASVVVDQVGTVVTVTDNRTVPVGGKIFYRLRGEIP